jgi:regulator of protease activity HflC (stomatin/prohibitin superfamily)
MTVLYAASAVAFVLALLSFAAGGGSLGTTALAPVGGFLVLVGASLGAAGRAAELRAPAPPPAAGTDRGQTSSPVEPPADDTGQATVPDSEPPGRFADLTVPLGLAAAGTMALFPVLDVVGSLPEPPPADAASVVVGLGLVLVGIAQMAGRWWVASRPMPPPGSGALKTWLRGGQWMALVTAAALIARGAGVATYDADRWLAWGLGAVTALCAGEVVVRALLRLLTPGAAERSAPVTSMVLEIVLHSRGPLAGFADVVERELGLSLRSTWAVGFIVRSLPFVVAGSALVLWLSTSLVVVGVEESAVRLRLGRLASATPVSPGLHVKWPWPIEAIERHPTQRTRTLPMGYAGPRKASLLWAEAHALDEHVLLLGDGRELVSVDATVVYRVRDVVRYALTFQNPHDVLEALAHRLLMQATVVSDLDRLLAVDRAEFSRLFANRLQAEADAARLGLEVLHVGFTSLHPPVAVAAEYQAVVSADIARRTVVTRAREDRERVLPAVASEAEAEGKTAEAAAVGRLAEATGGAAAFGAALAQYRAMPDAFRFQRRLETLEGAIADQGLFVVDRRVGTEAAELWIDLRSATPLP